MLDDECASVHGFDVNTTFLNSKHFPEVRGKVVKIKTGCDTKLWQKRGKMNEKVLTGHSKKSGYTPPKKCGQRVSPHHKRVEKVPLSLPDVF